MARHGIYQKLERFLIKSFCYICEGLVLVHRHFLKPQNVTGNAQRNDFLEQYSMIKSQLILDIFYLIFDDFEYEEKLRNQIQFLKEGETEHTGIGLFVNFEAEKGIENYRIPTEKAENRDINGKAFERMNGVELRNSALNILADADVIITDGIIDYIEIFNKGGENYPITEPTKYELEQVWVDSKNKKLVRN